jgi:dihydroflavonol-4-reductase
MRVLVTGATGFIGGNLARELCRRGYEVRALVRPGSNTAAIDDTDVAKVYGDILDLASLDEGVKDCQGVFHCAAAYTFWSQRPGDIYRTNIEGTRNVLAAARRAGVDRVVYTSTVSTVGPSNGVLATEDTRADPQHLVGHYKKSKYAAEQLALAACSDDLPVVVVNPTAPVGPWDVKPTPTGRIVLDYLLGRIPVYLKTGMNVVDVEDVAVGHILAMERGQPGQRYLLGNRNLELPEIFNMLQAITRLKAPRWWVPHWLAIGVGYIDELVEGSLLRTEPRIPVEGLRVSKTPGYVCCGKAVAELGQPQSPVEHALEKSVKWFRDHRYAPSEA